MAGEDRADDGVTNETPAPERPRRTRAAAPAPMPAEAADDPEAPEIEEDGGDILAEVVEVHQGAVGRVEAGDVSVTMGAIGSARADRIDVERGAIGAAMGGEIEVTQGYVGSVLAREVELEQVLARTIIAGEVRIEQPSMIGVLIAGKVEGDVRPLLDWRGALAIGAAFAVVGALLGRRRAGD